jgi:hypothetical protein
MPRVYRGDGGTVISPVLSGRSAPSGRTPGTRRQCLWHCRRRLYQVSRQNVKLHGTVALQAGPVGLAVLAGCQLAHRHTQ